MERTVLWKMLDEVGLEVSSLRVSSVGVQLDGTVLTVTEGRPLEVRYAVRCDPSFATRSAIIHIPDGPSVVLQAREGGRWMRGRGALPAMEGVLDVDISVTPSTNLLPIRRLEIPVGAEVAVDAAWVRLPRLEVERARQSYRRLAERRYRFTHLDSGFTAELEVDELGMVVRYGDLWERVVAGISG
jgi:hypothetical protein